MAAAAVKLAERIFPSLSDQRLLLIGAGEMIELAATHFAAQQAALDHRRQPHARARQAARATRFGAEAITLTELPERLAQFDIIVTCTASTLPIIGKGMLERVVKQRRHAPVFIVDLGVPRDVEPEAATLDDVFLYSVDDLADDRQGQPADPPRGRRAGRADDRRADRRTSCAGCEGRSVVPTIAALSAHHDALRSAELERARSMLAGGTPPEQVLDALARGLTNKLLHPPLAALNAAGEAERAELIALFSRIYGSPSRRPESSALAHRPGAVALLGIADVELPREPRRSRATAATRPVRHRPRDETISLRTKLDQLSARLAELDALARAPRTRRATWTAIAR